MRAHLLLALIVLLATGAKAQGVIVAKTHSCGTYLEHRKEGNRNQDAAYGGQIRAYVSGFNMGTSGKPTKTMPESDTALAYMDKYCRDHPLDDMGVGLFSLTRDLGGTR